MSYKLVMPDLGLPGTPLMVSMWLVEVGAEVTEGDRLLEILAGDVTVDLPAPAGGVLAATLVAEDDVVAPGQTLALIEPLEEEPSAHRQGLQPVSAPAAAG